MKPMKKIVRRLTVAPYNKHGKKAARRKEVRTGALLDCGRLNAAIHLDARDMYKSGWRAAVGCLRPTVN